MRSPAGRSVQNDPQTRRVLEGALQRSDLGESLALDAKGNAIVKPARAVKVPAAGEDQVGVVGKIEQIADGVTLAVTIDKVQELVTLTNTLAVKVNEMVKRLNADRRAAESAIADLVDALKRAKLMEK